MFANPLAGVITSGYNPHRVHPTLGRVVPHYGTDIGGRPRGGTHPIYAITDGTVLYTRTDSHHGDRTGGYLPRLTGNMVVLDHGRHDGKALRSQYGHLARVTVKPGQRVKAGQKIGTMGNTGDVDGAHLHLEIWVDGITVDPAPWMRARGAALGTGPTTPSSPPRPAPSSSRHILPDDQVRDRLKASGVPRPSDGLLSTWVRQWQERQLYAPGLLADAVWGPASEGHYDWTVLLQRTMKRWKGTRDTAIDGDYYTATRARVSEIQDRNHGGAYMGDRDDVPGPMFCQMLDINPHPGL